MTHWKTNLRLSRQADAASVLLVDAAAACRALGEYVRPNGSAEEAINAMPAASAERLVYLAKVSPKVARVATVAAVLEEVEQLADRVPDRARERGAMARVAAVLAVGFRRAAGEAGQPDAAESTREASAWKARADGLPFAEDENLPPVRWHLAVAAMALLAEKLARVGDEIQMRRVCEYRAFPLLVDAIKADGRFRAEVRKVGKRYQYFAVRVSAEGIGHQGSGIRECCAQQIGGGA